MLFTLLFDNFSVRASHDGTIWISVSDICAALHHSNSRVVLMGMAAEDIRKFPISDTLGRQQASWMVSLSGLSALLARSRKPAAARLKLWLTHEAIPTIERHLQPPFILSVTQPPLSNECANRRAEVRYGDCAEILLTLPSKSVDCLIADPPAGISLRGMEWDGDKGGRDAWIAWLTGIMQETYRILKPGGHGFVWALPRRSHWTALALENAGFEIRDRFTHISGNGTPTTHRLSGKWEGWATNLRPSVEDWWLVRKPMTRAVTSANMDEFGVGALHIAPSRIPVEGAASEGRYPTHMLLTHHPYCAEQCVHGCPVRELETQSGDQCGSPVRSHHRVSPPTTPRRASQPPIDAAFGHGDSGSAARFYHQFRFSPEEATPFLYMARASPRERQAGCTHLSQGCNTHPAVKPTQLLLHLLRLVTPPDGLVLDPFAGSGSAGVASVQGGFRYLGIEQEVEYVAIAQARINYALNQRYAPSPPF